ncbi:unnamed protein product [Aureobasidium vineae]|uniref:Uncharacterized protein n=1 Tax=Aureobasidium vineae TaxID=2773715 RepID=A0A9N8JFF6_9PEZI|nr:unnamed protein product [Aureobasidium vineae]
MSHAMRPGETIEEIDLSNDPEPILSRIQNPHFDVQLYVLNHRQSLKNKSTVWHRDADGSFHAVEWTSRFMYRRDRKPYLDRDGQVDQEWANEKWSQWCQRDFHPAVEAYTEYNEPAPEMIVLGNVNGHLHSADDALERAWERLSHAKMTLELSIHTSGLHSSGHLLAQTRDVMKDILDDMDIQLRTINESHRESTNQLNSLELAIKALVRSKNIAEKSRKRREEEDEKMVDTVKFLKKCLDNHCRLVNIVLGKPEPLVQQGTDLVQAMLSEMFGLPLPAIQEAAGEPQIEGEKQLESESEVEVIWEKFESQDLMDIEANECSGTESDEYIDDTSSEETESILDTSTDYKKTLRREKRERARDELYNKSGLSIVHDDAEDLDSSEGEERARTKRQKRIFDRPSEPPNGKLPIRREIPVMRQTTLSFDKVRKSRRLFSRKELSQNVTTGDQEEAEVTSPGPVRRNPRRATVKAHITATIFSLGSTECSDQEYESNACLPDIG